MDIDWNVVKARFAGMSTDELLEEAALHVDDYAPLAQRILEGEALARGISAAQIEARRSLESPAVETDGIELPALITSSDEKAHVQELAKILRERGIPAVARELDPKAFHASGHRVGRWGLMVAGRQAADAARLLEATMPAPEEEVDAAGCGCGGGCSAGGACDPSGEEWPEDGDWWKTVPGEDEIKS
ncbi:MAG: hypothetical protein ACYC9Y_01625 [Candidatus Methylomirabilia bacterium]